MLRATAGGGITFGGAPGGHALEVATPASAANRVLVSGAAAGASVSVQAQGADANIGLALAPRGTGALSANVPDGLAAGGGARGANAVDWQSVRTNSSRVAGGTNAVIGGGESNAATNTAAVVAGGSNNLATGPYSWSPGGLQADTRGQLGKGAWASGRFAANGDAQAAEHVLRRQGTDATPVRLTADGSGQGASNTVNLPNNGTFLVRLMVAARQVGGRPAPRVTAPAGPLEALVRRGATTASTVLLGGGAALAPSFADAAAAAWRLAVAADTTNGGLAISGTGEANKTIYWVARILSAEVVG